MKIRSLLALAAGIGALALATDADAAGTALDVQGARATGMASAVTGFIDDASAIYFNPAGIAQGRGLDAQAGVNLIVPSFNYTNAQTGHERSMSFNVATPFQVYGTYGITDFLTAGIGVYTPAGMSLNWPSGWEGRSVVTSASLETYDINPTVAVHFGRLRLGAGLQIVRATVELQRDIDFGSSYGTADIGGGSWGAGANGGIQVEAIKKYLLAGVTYRSAVRNDFSDGRAHFGGVPTAFQSQFTDQSVSTSFNQPDQIAIALASRPTDRLVVDAELVWFGWAKFHAIDLHFQNPALSTVEPKNWNNRVNVRAGGEYTITDHWRARAGILYDPTPSPSSTLLPDIPDANRLNLAIGGTYMHDSGAFIDVGYQFINLFPKTSTDPVFPGKAGGFVNILAISIGFTQTR